MEGCDGAGAAAEVCGLELTTLRTELFRENSFETKVRGRGGNPSGREMRNGSTSLD